MRSYLAVFLVAFVLAVLATPLAIRAGLAVRAIDTSGPDPIPRSGGWAVAASALLAMLLVGVVFSPTGLTLLAAGSNLGLIFAGTGAVLVLGSVDDVVRLRPRAKLAVEVLIAAALYGLGLRISILSLPSGSIALGHAVGLVLTVVWLVGITNAFNLIDGVDGVAAGSALFATLAVFIFAASLASPAVGLVSAALGGALSGFLPFNFAPARIYLGDNGSLSTGFLLAALSVESSIKAPTIVAVAIPILAFAVPVFDTANTMIRRLVRRQSLFARDRDHVHHRLLDRGLNPRQAAGIIYAVSAVFAAGSMLFLNPTARRLGVVLVMVGVAVTAGARFLRLHELNELASVARRGLRQPFVMARNAKIRATADLLERSHNFDELLDALAALFEPGEFDEVFMVVRHRAGDHIPKFWKLSAGRFSPVRAERRTDEWSMAFPFDAGVDRAWLGELQFHRRFGRPTLLIDINMIVEFLRPALVAAAGRVDFGEMP